jgi:large subunit ribosomal protein L3
MPPKPPLNWGTLLPPSFLLPSATRVLPTYVSSGHRGTPPSYTSTRTIKSTTDPRPSRFNYQHGAAALESTSTAALARKLPTTPLRTGVLAIKKGMTAMFDPETGKRSACTVLQLDRNVVLAHKTKDKHGYWAVQIGAGSKQVGNVTKPMLGHFAEAGVAPCRWVGEFRVSGEDGLKVGVGEVLGAGWFREGDWVDAKGVGKGKGFAGVSLKSPSFLLSVCLGLGFPGWVLVWRVENVALLTLML